MKNKTLANIGLGSIEKNGGYKITGDGKILETKWQVHWHKTLLNRGKGKQIKTKLTWGGIPTGPGSPQPWAGNEGKDDSNVAPFCTTKLAACTHLLSNVMRPERFQSDLILTLSWCLKKRIRSRRERFAPSYNIFFRVSQITIRATARIARNTTRFLPFHGG